VTDAIDEITPAGVVAGGRLREVDVIVYATGFHASEFLTPLHIRGPRRAGSARRLGRRRSRLPRAHGPRVPNLFCMYGPNTNLVANGSIIYFSECAAQYILSAIKLLLEQRANALDCRPDVHDTYNASVDEANARMVWGAATVNTWYRNAHGRIAQNWPFTLLEFWQRTRALDIDDYEVL